MPARIGTSGVAIACAGIEPVLDMRAKKDLDGNPLKVTFQAVVDNLATIANHKMGEGAESKPFAIVRNSGAKLTDRKINPSEMAIDQINACMLEVYQILQKISNSSWFCFK